MPESRPMPAIGTRCHELRITDNMTKREVRIIYYIGEAALAILDVFPKTTKTTPHSIIEQAKKRLRQYRALAEEGDT